MTTCGCNFKGPLYVVLSTDIGKIQFERALLLVEFFTCINYGRFKCRSAVDKADDFNDILHTIYINIVDYGCFSDILFRNNQTFELIRSGFNGYRQSSAYRLKITI